MRLCAALMVMSVGVTAHSRIARAQGFISGRVVQDSNNRPVDSVQILTSGHSTGFRTGPAGTFLVVAPPGPVRILARHLGYFAKDTSVEVRDGDTTLVLLRLIPTAIRLSEISVEDRAPALRVGLQDFEARRRHGIGRFLTDSALRSLQGHTTFTNVARRLGIKIERDPAGREIATATRGPTQMSLQSCPIQVYVDGVPMTGIGQRAFDLRPVKIDDIAAVEFYSGPAQTPVMFDRLSPCGVLLLWTR
ncbi:MAG: carboxypeptidase-like regulatory domain-containing protein [Gemmatimonadaceae bacterium]